LAFDIISLSKIFILNNKLLYQKFIKNFLFNIISLSKYFAEWFISKWLNWWSQIVSPIETCVHTNYLIIILKFQDYGRSTLSLGSLHFMIYNYFAIYISFNLFKISKMWLLRISCFREFFICSISG
jgi:hypothetical protein